MFMLYKLTRQWFHSFEPNLIELNKGFVKIKMIPLAETDSLHIHLYIIFLSTAGQVGTPILTNISLALLHRGTLSSSLMASL